MDSVTAPGNWQSGCALSRCARQLVAECGRSWRASDTKNCRAVQARGEGTKSEGLHRLFSRASPAHKPHDGPDGWTGLSTVGTESRKITRNKRRLTRKTAHPCSGPPRIPTVHNHWRRRRTRTKPPASTAPRPANTKLDGSGIEIVLTPMY